MEEFEKLVAESFQSELIPAESAAQPEMVESIAASAEGESTSPEPISEELSPEEEPAEEKAG